MTFTIQPVPPCPTVVGLRSRVGVALAVGVWIVLVGAGFAGLLQYKGTPGTSVEQLSLQPAFFPAEANLQRNVNRPTLVMFAHPFCPCTEATVHELQAIVAELPQLQPAVVIFTLPAGAPQEWRNASAVKRAKQFTGIRVIVDEDARLTKQFPVQTSGHVLLFDAAGKTQFSGGITTLRGHEGRSAGRSAIAALVQNQPIQRATTSVFGCPLFGPEANSEGKP